MTQSTNRCNSKCKMIDHTFKAVLWWFSFFVHSVMCSCGILLKCRRSCCSSSFWLRGTPSSSYFFAILSNVGPLMWTWRQWLRFRRTVPSPTTKEDDKEWRCFHLKTPVPLGSGHVESYHSFSVVILWGATSSRYFLNECWMKLRELHLHLMSEHCPVKMWHLWIKMRIYCITCFYQSRKNILVWLFLPPRVHTSRMTFFSEPQNLFFCGLCPLITELINMLTISIHWSL